MIADDKRVRLLGVEIDALTMDETLERCDAIVRDGGYAQHMSINAAKLVSLREDDRLRTIVNGCELINADGQSVVWASRVLGAPLPERVAGIDLMMRLIELAERRGWPVYVLGARPDVLETAVGRLCSDHPALRIAGYRDGYFTPSQAPDVCEAIRDSGAKILFVAMSSPQKEYFLGEYGAGLHVPFVMGVGGAIDVVAGIARRAPRTWQRLGLEWFYRLLQEPRRMFGRYARTNSRFLWLVVRERVTRTG